MKNFYTAIIGTFISLFFLFFLFYMVKGNLFWENKEEGLIYLIPIWSIVIGCICYYSSFKYNQAKEAYLNANKMDLWNEYRHSIVLKYSLMLSKLSLLFLPLSLLDYYFKDSEMLGTNISWICFLLAVAIIFYITYLLTKRKVKA